MKRIALFFAAIAALSSCMKENTLSPVQPVDGQVTIKAVAADTKTLLDGTAVLWEAEDVIAVVLEGTQKNMVEFTAETVADANATFVGTVAGAEFETAYAVYPKTAFDQSTYTVSHELPATQTGVVASGMNLSSALLDADQLKSGSAEAEFHNALTLLQVVVPAGVNSVALTSSQDGLVGSTDFYVTNGVLSRKSLNTKNTVTLSTGSELEAGTYSLLVYPGNPGNLTLTMVGTDGAELIKTVSGYTFEASEYYTINLTKIFNMDVNETEYVSPAGGTFEVDVVAAEEYEFSATATADWVSYAETKAFNGKTIVFNVDANTTGAEREANVTITWGTEGTKTFKVVQNAVFMDIVNDADGNPIQWEETFGVYANEADAKSGNNAKATYKNVFTIALSDDFSKGTYLVKNIFKAASYNDNNGQPVTNKGGQFYANYEAGKLTLLRKNSENCYGFTSDVVILYDEINKTFSAEPLKGYNYSQNSSCYIGGYSAAVKVEEPEVGGSFDVTLLYGTYNESVKAPYSYGNTETLVVSASDDASYDLLMWFFYTKGESSYSYDTAYGKVSADGKTITVSLANGSSSFYGPVSEFTLTFEAGVISGSYCGKMDYSAENPDYVAPAEPFDVTLLYGTYNESVKAPYSYGNTETLVVSASDDASYDLLMWFFYTKGESSYSYDTAYGKVSADGKTITVSLANGSSSFYGPVSEFTLTFEAGVISGSYCGKMDYSAQK